MYPAKKNVFERSISSDFINHINKIFGTKFFSEIPIGELSLLLSLTSSIAFSNSIYQKRYGFDKVTNTFSMKI